MSERLWSGCNLLQPDLCPVHSERHTNTKALQKLIMDQILFLGTLEAIDKLFGDFRYGHL